MKQKWVSSAFFRINLGYSVYGDPVSGITGTETGLCFIEWADRFEVSPAAQHALTFSNPVQQAAQTAVTDTVYLLEEKAGLNDKFHIHIQNRVPEGAGFGIIPSHTACLLRMLNKIANLGLSDTDLTVLGAELHEEVPFFIGNKPGILTGAAQEFTEYDIQPDAYIVACYPGVNSRIEAPENYLTLRTEPDFSLRNVLTEEPPEEWSYLLVNDYEQIIFQELALTGNLKDQMVEFGAVYASLNGKGTAVFGIFEQEFVAANAFNELSRLGYKANLTRPKFSPDTGVYLTDTGV